MKYDITDLYPCAEGLKYYASQPSFEEAWRNCPRGDWMMWISAKLGVDIRLLTRAKALCANTVRHLMRDPRSTAAVDAAMRYAAGEIDEQALERFEWAAYDVDTDTNAAAEAANAAAYAANAAAEAANAAAYAAKAAAYAAKAAAEAANAADYAANAANAANAADYAAYAARKSNRLQTSYICREVLTDAVREKVGAAWSSRGKKYFAPTIIQNS